MAKQPMRVGQWEFATKTQLEEFVRQIVARHADEQPLAGDDLVFVLTLLEQHPNAEVKVGCSVASVVVRRNPVYNNNRGFYLVRTDGTGTDFSWRECLRATPAHKKVTHALRVLVEPQTLKFKQEFFDSGQTRCELTGETIAFVGAHVDHVPPLTFAQLVADFCAEYGFELASIPLRNELADNKYVDEIDDDFIATLWQEYHRRHAVLRVVSRTANLSDSKLEMRQAA